MNSCELLNAWRTKESDMSNIQDSLDYRLPRIRERKLIDPHVVIVGAGASKAACPKDKNGKRVPLLKNILEVLSVESLLQQYGFRAEGIEDFESFYSNLYIKKESVNLCKKLEEAVYDFFFSLELPDEINLYDYLILSLTSKDLIISFNWDPFLLQAYNRNSGVGNLPQVVFPHGNVGVGICKRCKIKGYYGSLCPRCHNKLEKMPLLYPIGQKDYKNEEVIANEWNVAQLYLSRCAGLTIWGYSAPVTDASAVELLKDAFEESRTKRICPVTIINLTSVKNEQMDRWGAFYDSSMIVYKERFQDTILWRNPRVSLEALFDAILQQHPRENEKPFQDFQSIEALQQFIATVTEFDLWFPMKQGME